MNVIERIRKCEKVLECILTCQVYAGSNKKKKYEFFLDRVRKLDNLMNSMRDIRCPNERQKRELNNVKKRIGKTKGKAVRNIRIYEKNIKKRNFNIRINLFCVVAITFLAVLFCTGGENVVDDYRFKGSIDDVKVSVMTSNMSDELSDNQIYEVIREAKRKVSEEGDCSGDTECRDLDVVAFDSTSKNYYKVYVTLDHRCESTYHKNWLMRCKEIKIKK